jgi:hypothetical protein
MDLLFMLFAKGGLPAIFLGPFLIPTHHLNNPNGSYNYCRFVFSPLTFKPLLCCWVGVCRGSLPPYVLTLAVPSYLRAPAPILRGGGGRGSMPASMFLIPEG